MIKKKSRKVMIEGWGGARSRKIRVEREERNK